MQEWFSRRRYSKIAFIVAGVLVVAGLLLKNWALIRVAVLALVVAAGAAVLESSRDRLGGG